MTSEQKVLDFSGYESTLPKYKWRDILAEQDPTMAQGASCQAIFKLPSTSVYNLNKSTLEFTLTETGQVDDYVGLHCGFLPIEAIKLSTSRNVTLCEIQDLQPYSRVTLPVTESRENWLNRQPPSGIHSGFAKSDSLVGAVDSQQVGGDGNIDNAPAGHNYWMPSAVLTSGADNTDLITTYKIPFSDIRHSIFDLEQDVYWAGEELTMTITFPSTNNLCFDCDTALLAGDGVLDAEATITNLKIRLAIETNPIIEQKAIQMTNNGHSCVFQNTTQFKYSTGTATSFAKQNKVNSADGVSLLRAYHALFLNTGGAVRWNMANPSSEKFTTVRTNLNQKWESDYDLTSATEYEPYYQNKYVFDDSIIKSGQMWEYFPVVVQDYSGLGGNALTKTKLIGDSGVSLASPQEVGVKYATKNNVDYTYICYCVCNKVLKLSPQGVEVMP